MTIPTRPAPPPPQSSEQQQNRGVQQEFQNNSKITIKLPPPPSTKNNFQLNLTSSSSSNRNYSSIGSSNNNVNNKSITRHFPPAKTRYAPVTNWNGSPFDSTMNSSENNVYVGNTNKRAPPPRPPPPKVPTVGNRNILLKKPSGPPQSVNVLTNLFGRRKPATPTAGIINNKKQKQHLPPPKIPQLLNSSISASSSNSSSSSSSSNVFATNWPTTTQQSTFSNNTYTLTSNSNDTNEFQLISFDSPPSSPTFTQKSNPNSDCVSVDSFSSDSNFSSPHNGSVSQPESGFEDDFSASNTTTNAVTSPADPWETLGDPYFNTNLIGANTSRSNYMYFNELNNPTSHPVRNLNILQQQQKITDNHLCNGKSLLPPQQSLTMPTIIRPKTQKGLAPKPPTPGYTKQLNGMSIALNQNDYDEDDHLPMPNCPPPPPPPSNLENIDFDYEENCGAIFNNYDDMNLGENIDITSSPYGIALYSFEGLEDGDLSFKENEKIYLLSRLNDEWFMGKTKSGCEGIFPSNYINVKVPLGVDNKNSSNNGANLGGNSQKYHNLKNSSENLHKLASNCSESKVRVLYSFEAEQPDDLTLMENDIVHVLYRINEDWLYGEINNKRGQFPANFIENVPQNLPLKIS